MAIKLKEEKIGLEKAIETVWACDKYQYPLQVANISMTRYNERFDNDLAIRFGMNNLSKDGKVLNIPLFLIEYINNFEI